MTKTGTSCLSIAFHGHLSDPHLLNMRPRQVEHGSRRAVRLHRRQHGAETTATAILLTPAPASARRTYEFGYLKLKPEQSNIFFKLMDERYHRRSTITTTNLDYDEWHNFLGNKPMVDALLSRLRRYCRTVRIKGPSLRDPQG